MPIQLLIYNGINIILLLLLLPFLCLLALFSPKYRDGFLNRFGILPYAFKKAAAGKENIWIHSASAGEVKCVLELAENLRRKYPSAQIVFTTTGINGQRMIKNAVQNAVTCYLPLDICFFIKPLAWIIKPKTLVVVETEYWPNLFYFAKKEGARIVLVNGRFSSKSISRYRSIKSLIKKTFSYVDRFAMRSPEDAKTLISLGAEEKKVEVTGDLKYEIPVIDPAKKAGLEALLKPVLKDKVLVLGSVHAREIPYLFEVLKRVREKTQGISVIIAPRFLEELGAFTKMLDKEAVRFIQRSKVSGSSDKPEVIVLDTIGELSIIYGLGTVAFVGGSLVDGIGGHNLLEPVYLGKPVLFGPYAYNFKEMAGEVKLNLAGFQVKNPEDMALKVNEMLGNPSMLASIAGVSKAMLEKKKGSLLKTLELI